MSVTSGTGMLLLVIIATDDESIFEKCRIYKVDFYYITSMYMVYTYYLHIAILQHNK